MGTHSSDPAESSDFDVVVLGAGMAGLTAASRLASGGVRLLVIEKAEQFGGNALLSGGYLWCVETLEQLRKADPGCDPVLGQTLVHGFPHAVEWVTGSGVDVDGPKPILGRGQSYQFDVLAYLRWCIRRVESAGGHVLMGTSTETLLTTGGQVSGVRIRDREGVSEVNAEKTILATGGFQGAPDLVRNYLDIAANDVLLRSNPASTGDGFRLARSVGARVSPRTGGFYGHLVPSPLQTFEPADFRRLSFPSSDLAILLDEEGFRFVEEALGYHRAAQALVRRPGRRGLVVFDRATREEMATSPHVAGAERIDRVGEAIDAGAHVAQGDSFDALGERVGQWGFAGPQVSKSLRAYETNPSVSGAPTRRSGAGHRSPIESPPYYAIEVRPAITFTYGGIDIDANAAVLGADGLPVPGVYAAGADAGGVYDAGYAGGLSLAAVFGLRAAASAEGARVSPFS